MGQTESSHRTCLTDTERENLLKRLDAQGSASGSDSRAADNRRMHKRWGYRQSDIAVTVEHPAGGVSRLLVCARNLSANGIGFIHAGFVHKGSHCKLLLRENDGGTHPIAGEVASCRHIDGMLHEIGVRFEHHIDVARFVRASASRQESLIASVRLSDIHGRILYVDDSVDDRDLMKFIFQACGAEICAVADGMDAIALAEKTEFSAVMTELGISGISGIEVAQTLRSAGFSGPVIGVTADERPETTGAAMAAGCSAVLIKPLDLEQVVGALGPLAKKQSAIADHVEPLFSTRWNDFDMRPLINTFIKNLQANVQQLRHALGATDWQSAEKLCLQLKGSAGGYGYASISEIAAQILKAVMQKSSSSDWGGVMAALDRLCAGARLAIDMESETPSETRKAA